MSLLYYGVGATNSFDSLGHYARAEPLVGACAAYVKTVTPGCSANFAGAIAAARRRDGSDRGSTAALARVVKDATWQVKTPTAGVMKGLLGYLIGSGR